MWMCHLTPRTKQARMQLTLVKQQLGCCRFDCSEVVEVAVCE